MWAHLRTAFVLFHVTVISLMAFPAPSGGMSRSAWKDPTVQAEFAGWRERLALVGVSLSAEEFEDTLWDFAKGYMDARNAVLDPLKPYFLYCGTWQSWRMFVAPHVYPARLHVDVLVGEDWQTVYVGRSDEHTWLRDVFDHDRVRSATFRYAWRRYGKYYKPFSAWIARRAAADFPEATKVRVRYLKGRSPTPEQVRSGDLPDTSWIAQRILTLESYR